MKLARKKSLSAWGVFYELLFVGSCREQQTHAECMLGNIVNKYTTAIKYMVKLNPTLKLKNISPKIPA